jgi:type I site-specific restriction endonuclease
MNGAGVNLLGLAVMVNCTFFQARDPNYRVRVTVDDGAPGEQYLLDFQDNEKAIPTIRTTSQKLSTGVDRQRAIRGESANT